MTIVKGAVDGLSDETNEDFDELEKELRSDCMARLNNWKGLLETFDSDDAVGPRCEQLQLFAM